MIKILLDDENSDFFTLMLMNFIIIYFVNRLSQNFGFIYTVISSLLIAIRHVIKRQKQLKAISTQLDLLTNNVRIQNVLNTDNDISCVHESINNLSDYVYQLNQNLEAQKRSTFNIMNDISSRLRSPVKALELLNLDQSDDELVIKSRNQIKKLNNLVDVLVKLGALENNEVNFEIQSFSINKLICETIEELENDFSKHMLEISYVSHSAFACFDFDKSKEVLRHILSNKLEFAQMHVNIICEENPLSVYVKISDDGPSIENKHRNRIFDKFYSGNSTEGALGVGLAIARELMLHQNGDITLEGDNTFVVRFSKNASTSIVELNKN